MSLSLKGDCSRCHKQSTTIELIPCEKCRVVFYCSDDHRVNDSKNHQLICDAIEQVYSDAITAQKERRLLGLLDSFDEGLWEESCGQRYLKAGYLIVQILLPIKNYSAFEEAKRWAFGLLERDQDDNLGIRKIWAPLLLRKG